MGLHVTKAQAEALFKAHGYVPPEPKKPKRAEKPTDGMNKLERAFADHLEWERRMKRIQWWRFGRVTFVLTVAHDGVKGCRLTPDFCTLGNDGMLTWFETKGGFEREDSVLKRKMVAAEFPGLRFVLVKRIKGEWKFSEFGKAAAHE